MLITARLDGEKVVASGSIIIEPGDKRILIDIGEETAIFDLPTRQEQAEEPNLNDPDTFNRFVLKPNMISSTVFNESSNVRIVAALTSIGDAIPCGYVLNYTIRIIK